MPDRRPAESHCELCELLRDQCVHGLAERRNRPAGVGKTRGNAKSVHPSNKQAIRGPTTATVMATDSSDQEAARAPRLCARCHDKARYGRYRLCLGCGKDAGFVLCTKCGRYFDPTAAGRSGKRTCRACARRPRGSVWAPTSAGSPGLGKRS